MTSSLPPAEFGLADFASFQKRLGLAPRPIESGNTLMVEVEQLQLLAPEVGFPLPDGETRSGLFGLIETPVGELIGLVRTSRTIYGPGEPQISTHYFISRIASNESGRAEPSFEALAFEDINHSDRSGVVLAKPVSQGDGWDLRLFGEHQASKNPQLRILLGRTAAEGVSNPARFYACQNPKLHTFIDKEEWFPPAEAFAALFFTSPVQPAIGRVAMLRRG